MVYLRNNDSAQVTRIPKNITGTGSLSLTLRSTTTLAEYEIGSVADSGESALYWCISVSLPEGMDNGEYEYELRQGGVRVASGVLRVGEYSTDEEYNSEIEYEQYENE